MIDFKDQFFGGNRSVVDFMWVYVGPADHGPFLHVWLTSFPAMMSSTACGIAMRFCYTCGSSHTFLCPKFSNARSHAFTRRHNICQPFSQARTLYFSLFAYVSLSLRHIR